MNRWVDLHKGLSPEYLRFTEGKPYKHILEGGLSPVDIKMTEEEIQMLRKERQAFIKQIWDL